MTLPPSPSLEKTITDRDQHYLAVRQLLNEATDTISWLDGDFSDSSLNTVDSLGLIKQFLRDSRRRRLRFMMSSDQYLASHAPRFSRLLELHSEQIQCRLLLEGQWQGQSLLIVDARHVLTRAQPQQWRGYFALDAVAQAEQLAAKFDFLWQESGPCLPPTTLGL